MSDIFIDITDIEEARSSERLSIVQGGCDPRYVRQFSGSQVRCWFAALILKIKPC